MELNEKVDKLYEIVERISGQITVLTTERKEETASEMQVLSSISGMIPQNSPTYSNFKSSMEHKDILVDGSSSEANFSNNNDRQITPDIQIRRLTAQLTAAYNRIAALEEQLLAARIRS